MLNLFQFGWLLGTWIILIIGLLTWHSRFIELGLFGLFGFGIGYLTLPKPKKPEPPKRAIIRVQPTKKPK